MGIEVDKFVTKIDDELKCCICYGVLENPIQIVECEHTFCLICIQEWVRRTPKCPIDRRDVTTESLKPASRLLNSFLNRLEMKCSFREFGCNSVVNMDSMASHTSECAYNPEVTFLCDKGCGVMLNVRQRQDHNCILEDILSNVENLSQKVKNIETENSELHKRIEILEQRSHINEELEEQLEAIEKKYTEMLSRLSAFRLSLNETLDPNLANGQTQETQRNSLMRDESNSSMKSHQRLGAIKTIVVEVDYKSSTIELWANIREPIRSIKTRIREQENISVECQCLLHNNQLLDNDKTLEEYKIKSMKFVLVKRPIKVDVIVFSQNMSFLLEPFDTISQLIEKIHKIKGFNVTLTYFGQILDESRTFHSYKIRDRTKLKVNAIHCNNDSLHCNTVHSL